jgi:hypothetical protein
MSCSKFGVLVGLGAGSLLGCASALTEDASKRLLSDATIAAADGRMDEATDLQLRCLEWCAEPYGSKAASLLRQMPRPDERHLATVWAVVARLEERALEDELTSRSRSRLFVLVAATKGVDAKRPLALLHRGRWSAEGDQILAELASSMPRALTMPAIATLGFGSARIHAGRGSEAGRLRDQSLGRFWRRCGWLQQRLRRGARRRGSRGRVPGRWACDEGHSDAEGLSNGSIASPSPTSPSGLQFVGMWTRAPPVAPCWRPSRIASLRAALLRRLPESRDRARPFATPVEQAARQHGACQRPRRCDVGTASS